MGLSGVPGAMDNVSLLSSVLRILAKYNAATEDDDEVQHSCIRFQLRCLLVAEELERVKKAINPDTEDVFRLLAELDDFVRSSTAKSATLPSVSGTPARLVALHSEWLRVQEQPSLQRQTWLANCLDYSSKARNICAGDALQRFYNECQELHPESRSIPSDEPPLPKRMRRAPPHGVSEAADLVFESLLQATTCPCHPTYEYDARLCIATHHRPDESMDAARFDLFLTPDRSWQEAQVGVTSRQSVVAFQLNNQQRSTGLQGNKNQAPKEVTQLCKPINSIRRLRWRSHRINFALEQGKLWSRPPEKQTFPTELWGDPISLEDFISTKTTPFTDMTKRIVAVLLGYAVLHLQDTRWIQPTWGPSQVIFQSISTAVPIKPYVQVSLATRSRDQAADDAGECQEDEDEEDDDDFFGDDGLEQHPLPCLVMLAIMLMQVYLGRTFRSFMEEFGTGEAEVSDNNDRYALAAQVFEKYSKVISFSEEYWKAVDKCLDPHILDNEKGESVDKFGLRKIIYDEIIGPLEDELAQGRFSADNLVSNLDVKAANLDLADWGREIQLLSSQGPGSGIHAQSLTSSMRSPGGSPEMLRKSNRPSTSRDHSVQASGGRYSKAGLRKRATNAVVSPLCLQSRASAKLFDDKCRQEDMPKRSRDAYLSWKQDVLQVYDEFLSCDGKHEATKIAILDTGLDLSHPDFKFDAERRQRIRGYRNFTESASCQGVDDVKDESGHGTHTTGLLLDFAPDAAIFVAKIAEHDPSSGRFVAQAIRHAVDIWKVEIISMSFGFTTRDGHEYDLVEQALAYAHGKGVLLFAAASNNGANQQRTYPARHDYVVCVNSAAADGMPSRFNPPPGQPDNFSTLGEAVESSWPTDLCDREVNECCLAWKSGTSFATPIAAGIAAFLLQYARENLEPSHVRLMKDPRGLRAVLQEMSLACHGYDYVAPSMHPDNFFGKSKESVKLRISDLLGNS